MESLFTFTSPPGPCGYLPDREWQLRYEVVGQLAPEEYADRLKHGWRRFGYSLFRPACPACTMCRSLRVPVATFRPDRSQKRAWAANADDLTVTLGPPDVSRERLDLYDRFHRYQADAKGWPDHDTENVADYIERFIDNPFATVEWQYRLGDRLVGVGYADHLADGLSAIYFYHDPDHRTRSLGTFNVLSLLRHAAAEGLPHLYLGFHVAGCRSLEYKARFRPNEVHAGRGEWVPFLT
jgi:arginine-tRNA-protein transferase